MIEQRAGRAALALAVAAALAGLVVGAAAALLENRPYRAEETLVLVRGSAPLTNATAARSLAATIRALGDGQVVTSNVARALGLSERAVRERTSVSLVDGTAALLVRAEGPGPTEAVRLAQQYGVVLTTLVRSRFAPLALQPFDPTHGAGEAPRQWAPNLLPAGLVGLLAGLGGGAFLLRRNRRPEAAPAPEPQPAPAPGAWSLAELRRRVEAAREREPERVAEWETYLGILAEHEVNGVLPASFGPLIDEVFGSLLY
jgi:hypothetical protein